LYNSEKHKILNDPVYGFIKIPPGFISELIAHPWFQRLRRIKQGGLNHYVYPGATHTRFQHALGALHLMGEAVDILRSKGHEVTEEEHEAVSAAILLHDMGHGPFSHALEHGIVPGIDHEVLSEAFMRQLNVQYKGRLGLAIDIFNNWHKKKFLHQLVSGQLDMDRLDYLSRDSFFTGVAEGKIGSDRIIKMLDVVDDKLAVESKGIYSIEKFLVARRLMYWQVYHHKTALSAEQLLVRIIRRARQLADSGKKLFATPALEFFLYNKLTAKDLEASVGEKKGGLLGRFAQLDDTDIASSLKVWQDSGDKLLETLCRMLIERRLFKIKVQKAPFSDKEIASYRDRIQSIFGLDGEQSAFLAFQHSVSNHAYTQESERINIIHKDGQLIDIADASDMLNISVLSRNVVKYFLCFPEECRNE
jgi:hypothetical protein